MQIFALLSRALFHALLLPSLPSEQRFWIETCACSSSGWGRTWAGLRGRWPGGRGSSHSAASGWNHTGAPCSPLWPTEVVLVRSWTEGRVDQSKDRNWQRLRGRKNHKGNSVHRLAVWTVRDVSFHCWVLLLYRASPFGKLAIIFYWAAGRFLFFN